MQFFQEDKLLLQNDLQILEAVAQGNTTSAEIESALNYMVSYVTISHRLRVLIGRRYLSITTIEGRGNRRRFKLTPKGHNAINRDRSYYTKL